MTTTPQTQPPGPIQVGPYTLLNRLGEGGMGVVHLARRPDGNRVALKVLRPHIVGDDEARERLAREVNSLSRIRSRWVAEIVDSDPWGPVPYVATRYVPGLSLHDHVLQEGPVEDLGWFAGRLADALHAVHCVGVLHRDIKPSNVLMEGRAPILIDFGLARVADDPRLTHTGWLLGTPGYLAPEILYGEDATPASDVHSWAATVAYAGTGHPPFGRGPSMAIMDRVRRGEHDLNGVPRDLRDLLHAALSPEPLDRPTLAELRDHLQVGGHHQQQTPNAPLTVPLVAATTVPGTPSSTAGPVDALAGPTRGWPTEVETAVDREDGHEDGREPPTAWLDDEADGQALPALSPATWAVRFRRNTLVLVLLGLVAVGTGLAPYVTVAGLVALAWLLRAGSLAGSRHQERRVRRGPRWYDAFALPVSYPWFFVVAIPGLVMLGFWSGGLALAAALVCFALAAPIEVALVATGATLGAAMWWGTGGSRFRGPLRRVVAAVSGNPWLWCAVTGIAVIAAVAAGVMLRNEGVHWTPAGSGPFARGSALRDLF